MTRRKPRAKAATASDTIPPFVYNLGFLAIAMAVAAMALFAG